MLKIRLLGSMVLLFFLSGCAAIQGARGDAAVAKETAAAQAVAAQQSTKAIDVDEQTITPPTQPATPSQNATTNASKVIAPLH
jgi:hypothetical protein